MPTPSACHNRKTQQNTHTHTHTRTSIHNKSRKPSKAFTINLKPKCYPWGRIVVAAAVVVFVCQRQTTLNINMPWANNNAAPAATADDDDDNNGARAADAADSTGHKQSAKDIAETLTTLLGCMCSSCCRCAANGKVSCLNTLQAHLSQMQNSPAQPIHIPWPQAFVVGEEFLVDLTCLTNCCQLSM